MVLHSNLVLVVKLTGVISPSPLAVVAVAQSAATHGRVAHKKQDRVVALAGRSAHRAHLVSFGKRVESHVAHSVDIFHAVKSTVVLCRHSHRQQCDKSQKDSLLHVYDFC